MYCRIGWAGRGVFLLAAFALGCTSSGPPAPKLPATVPVTGVVTLDDKPLADAMVTFMPESEAGYRGAVGRTDSTGKYEVSSDIGDGKQSKGAIPGKYRVIVSKFVKPDGTPLPEGFNQPPMSVGAMESLPPKFSMSNQTKLSYEVPAGGGTYDIKVTSK